MKTLRISFKTNKPTGRYNSFYSAEHIVKVNGKQIGVINDGDWSIRLMVIKDGDRFTDNNPNCNWKWITLSQKSETFDAAKVFLRAFIEIIDSKYPLRYA